MFDKPCLAQETGLVGPLTIHAHCDSLTWIPERGSVYITTTLRTLALFATGVKTVRDMEAMYGFILMGHLNRN